MPLCNGLDTRRDVRGRLGLRTGSRGLVRGRRRRVPNRGRLGTGGPVAIGADRRCLKAVRTPRHGARSVRSIGGQAVTGEPSGLAALLRRPVATGRNLVPVRHVVVPSRLLRAAHVVDRSGAPGRPRSRRRHGDGGARGIAVRRGDDGGGLLGDPARRRPGWPARRPARRRPGCPARRPARRRPGWPARRPARRRPGCPARRPARRRPGCPARRPARRRPGYPARRPARRRPGCPARRPARRRPGVPCSATRAATTGVPCSATRAATTGVPCSATRAATTGVPCSATRAATTEAACSAARRGPAPPGWPPIPIPRPPKKAGAAETRLKM